MAASTPCSPPALSSSGASRLQMQSQNVSMLRSIDHTVSPNRPTRQQDEMTVYLRAFRQRSASDCSNRCQTSKPRMRSSGTNQHAMVITAESLNARRNCTTKVLECKSLQAHNGTNPLTSSAAAHLQALRLKSGHHSHHS